MRPFLPAILLAFCVSGQSQQRPVLTTADYAHAEQFMGYNTAALVTGMVSHPNWQANDHLSYRVTRENSSQFMLVDPAKGTAAAPAFDNAKLAAALSKAAGTVFDANKLPFGVQSGRVGAVSMPV